MLEKIKITIPKTTNDILNKDCENFKFLKSDKSLNKNLFLNTLIVNYYEKYSANEESFKLSLLNVLNNDNSMLENVLSIIQKNDKLEYNKKTEILNIKPTKLSEKHITFIENNLIKNESISSFYRNLFTSYSRIPQNYRELIIFKETYDVMIESIEKDRQVCITLNNGDVLNYANIYKIESSKEEFYNYVLIVKNNRNITCKLSKIKYVSLLNTKRDIDIENINTFEKQIKYGVQYPLHSSNDEPVIVKMSNTGKILFDKIYLYRPIPDKIEDNLYYFYGSHDQVMHYFKRFGYDGMIISPIELAEKMNNYYFLSNRKYSNKLNKNKK